MNLMRRDNPTLPDDYFVNSFISRLSAHIQHHLQCHKPTDMREAMWYARRIEQANPMKHALPATPPPPVRRQVLFEPARNNTFQPNTAIQQAKQKNVCYKCKEPWFPGHRQVCKLSQQAQIKALQEQHAELTQIVYINEADDEDLEPQGDQLDPSLQISMHAILGMKTGKYTFSVTVLIGNTLATALVDSGSTATFMTPHIAQTAQCQLTATNKLKVIVADGGHLWTEFMCVDCPYSIQGESFKSNFRILQLKGYDLILGADWIHQHSPVELDY
jgi:hypothetical protein